MFNSTQNNMTIGSSGNSTINISTTTTSTTSIVIGASPAGGTSTGSGVNIGGTSSNSKVNIRGLDTLINSTNTDSSTFARNINYPTYSNNNNCFYMLPFSSNQNLLIQWGFVNTPNNKTNVTVTFQISFANTPYVFLTKYNDGGSGRSAVIVSSDLNNQQFTADTAIGDSDAKSDFNWLAIGAVNKSSIT
jgi:hypothetical protein